MTGPHSPRRRSLVGAAGAGLALSGIGRLHAAESAEWQRADLAAAGLDPELPQRLDEVAGKVNLHAVVVVRGGRLALERYYEGTDERWGRPLGKVAFNAGTLHDLRSVSKNVVGLLYGIALAERKVPALDTPVVEAFPAYADLMGDAPRRRILVSHVLSMTMGLDWNEDLPYSDPRNSEIAMETSADRYRYVLGQAIVSAPGEKWRYCGGATALLGGLIARGTGMPLLEYARSRLFAPLGIGESQWTRGSDNVEAAASGLRLRAGDLARIGQLVLQRGQWSGQAVVPAEWIAASLTPRIQAFDGIEYGYQWYAARRADGNPVYLGLGNGGQRLVVTPSRELTYVIFMGNYSRGIGDQVQAALQVQRMIGAAVR